MTPIRIVLKPQATWADVLSTGGSDSWERRGFTPLWQDQPHIKRYRSVDGRCSITYVQDPLREIRYYHLAGDDLETHAGLIRSRILAYTREEIATLMADALTPGERIAAVYLAACASPDPDEALLAFLTHALVDLETSVRWAAVDAALVAAWPALRAPLERTAAADPYTGIRVFAAETIKTLKASACDAALAASEFTPLPADPRRVAPVTGVRDDWYEAAFGERPPPPPSGEGELLMPPWLAELIREGDWGDYHWHSPELIHRAASLAVEFKRPRIVMLEEDLADNRALWGAMVPVANGPQFIDRVARASQSRLYVNRDCPEGLLLALSEDAPPTLWIPAGRSRAEVESAASAYFFAGIPPLPGLPYQGRLFLATQVTLGGTFLDLVRAVQENPFTDMVSWGSSQPADPYPEEITDNVTADDVRRFQAQAADCLPWRCVRTRYSRSVIQLIDWRNGYFADLYFRPTSSAGWVEAHNSRLWTDFPPGTPVDVVGALSGLACLGPDRIRQQAEGADAPDQRRGMLEIVGFLERAPELS